MAITEHPSEIVVCHMRTGCRGRKRSGSHALYIGLGKKSKLAFIHGQLTQPYQLLDYVKE
jgi:hypothetical protein